MRLSATCLSTFVLLVAILSTGCGSMAQVGTPPVFQPEAPKVVVEEENRHWWQLRFSLAWPEDEEPDFSLHALIAEQLLLPAIAEHQADIPLWRFHRRAARTPAGHQFSLIFFADEDTASAVHEQVDQSPLAHWLTDQDFIERAQFDRRNPEELGRLELSSDKDWPLAVQRSWPYYIMGVSQAWLLHVQTLSEENGLVNKTDPADLLQHYQEVDANLNAQWRDHGQRAYLHHLNAIYGYQPLFIQWKGLHAF